jgi:hypothetical protein
MVGLFEMAAFRYYANRLENMAIELYAGTPARYDEIIHAFMLAVTELERIQDDVGTAPERCPDNYRACMGGICVPPGTNCPKPGGPDVGDPPGGGGCPDPTAEP